MNEQFENFMNKNVDKKNIGFNPLQEKEVESIINDLIKPVLKKIEEKLNTYSNCYAEINLINKNVELSFFQTSIVKFVYRLNFTIEGDKNLVTGQYCIPNIYGEAINFTNTKLKKDITELNKSDIDEDFSNSFIVNVDI